MRCAAVAPAEAVAARHQANGTAAAGADPGVLDVRRAARPQPDPTGAVVAARAAVAANPKLARTEVVARAKGPKDPALDQDYRSDFTTHPEYPAYLAMMSAAGLSDRAADAFQMVLGAMGEHADHEHFPELSKRNPSDWLTELTAYMGDALDIGATKMALWSGGIELSRYAFSKGYTPLEETKLGHTLDNLVLHNDWALKAPLWNALSKAFVQHAGREVHVFVRSVQPDSVLLAEEVPGLRNLEALTGKPINTAWHAVYTDPKTKQHLEIDAGRKLVADFAYPTRVLAAAALYDFNQGFPKG